MNYYLFVKNWMLKACVKKQLNFFINNFCFGWILWHINPCRLFNAKSWLHIYLHYVYMICKPSLLRTLFLNKPKLICLHTIKWSQVLISNTNNFICKQLNGFTYCYSSLIFIKYSYPIQIICTQFYGFK